MIKLPEAELLDILPAPLKYDTDMICLSYAIKKAAEKLFIYERSAMIFNFTDELPEKILDALAHDLHVDWYDYGYPVDIKRAVIKNSLKIHQKMGTKYAVETALRSVYKDAWVSEWFEYGGRPYHFKIDVDISGTGLAENTGGEIAGKVSFYKNLRSHCESISYRLCMDDTEVRAAAAAGNGISVQANPILERNVQASAGAVSAAQMAAGITVSVGPHLEKRADSCASAAAAGAGLFISESISVGPFLMERLEAAPHGTAAAYCTVKYGMLAWKGEKNGI